MIEDGFPTHVRLELTPEEISDYARGFSLDMFRTHPRWMILDFIPAEELLIGQELEALQKLLEPPLQWHGAVDVVTPENGVEFMKALHAGFLRTMTRAQLFEHVSVEEILAVLRPEELQKLPQSYHKLAQDISQL